MDTATWLPPYKAYGYIMGDQHLVTFDQTHYNFAGRCSYILARDMVDDSFTVVVNYNNRPRQPQIQSIIVQLRLVAIEVDRNGKVKINDQETDLPFSSYGSVRAVRDQNVVRVQDFDDLVVEMDATRGIISIGISGWYHGRTAGLLGTYDNERFNDLTDASRKVNNVVEEFANSWEVSPSFCRTRNTAGNDVLDESLPEVQACNAYLNSSSSYYTPCFEQLSSEQSVRACVEYVRSGESQLKAQCRAGEQYRYMCRRKGVVIGTPAECVTCAFPEGREVAAGYSEEVRSEKGQRSADVVFVVDESECNSWARSGIPRMAAQLENALLAQGMQKSRFGLVSYYGYGQPALVHTIQGQMFGDSNNLLKAAETLSLTASVSDRSPTDALRSAMMYPYRVGVAKILVLVPCWCRGDLGDLASVLQSHGFVLHVLQEQPLMVAESSNNSPSKVFGADRDIVMTRRGTSRISSSLGEHVQLPQDQCVSMALATNGSVFDFTHMRERDRIQREFLEAFATRAAFTAWPPACQVCSCHDDGAGGGHSVCRLCEDNAGHENHIPFWLQSPTTSLMSVINDLHHRVMTALLVPPLNSTTAA
nr:apolipophorins-like protein [Pomacea canaliculata]